MVALCALLTPRVAAAQQAPDPARAAFDEGMVALQGNRFRDAVEALETSFALRPLPVVSYNLGLAYRGIGRNVDAVVAFDRYLRAPEPDALPERLEALRREIPRLRSTLVTVRLALRPAHATVRVDGHSVVLVDRAAIVDPGLRTLDVTAEGYQPSHRELDLAPGATVEVETSLTLLESRARLLIEPSALEATVYVDQRLAGVGQTEVDVGPGRHQVVVRALGYLPFERSVWSAGRGVIRVSAALQGVDDAARQRRRSSWVLPVAIAGGVIAVTATIIGVVVLTRGTEVVPEGRWGTFREGMP